MKRIVAAFPLALAAAAVAAPAVSSAAGNAPAAETQTPKVQLYDHSGPCPFAAAQPDV